MTTPDFWRELRRRLPGVDFVIVAPEAQSTDDPAALPGTEGEAMRDAVAYALRILWPKLTSGLPHPGGMRVRWYERADGTDVVEAEAAARHDGLDGRDPLSLVESVEHELADDGWEVQRRDSGTAGFHRLLATAGLLRLEVRALTEPAAVDAVVRSLRGVHRGDTIAVEDVRPVDVTW